MSLGIQILHGRQKRTNNAQMATGSPGAQTGQSDLSQMLSLKVTKAPIYLTPGTGKSGQDEPGTSFCTAEQAYEEL